MADMESSINGGRGVAVYMGLGTPAARSFCATALLGVAMYATKPSLFFDGEGKMRPFKPLTTKDPEATNAHFLAVLLTAGTLVYVFT